MQAVTEFAPLVAFFVAYVAGGLYVATAVLMAAMVMLVALDWLRFKRVPPLHSLSAVLVLIFGGATLILHNPLFIQWKPTVFFWLVSLAFLGSRWIGARTLTERLLAPILAEGFGTRLTVTAPLWRRLNLLWVAFYALLGALNVAVLEYLSERAWAALKLIDVVLMLIFVGSQLAWLATRAASATPPALGSGDGPGE
ncbi:MAG TPA: inner membrane-spanning protein YciB [Steroidobacteraceae bacterium]|nr:inner membrane-spanning protein YciB [Steroidobacteraceae bacterium]